MHRWAWIAVAAALVAHNRARAQGPPIVVRTAVVETRPMQDHHRVIGSLRAVARGEVAALEEGHVVEVAVREGDVVRKGDVIARIDDRRLAARHAELEAALAAAEVLVEQRRLEATQAERDLERSQRLVGSRAISHEAHEHRETELAIAQSRLASEERRVAVIDNQRELSRVRLADAVVLAPYDGAVVARHAEPGEWILAGEPFVTLVSTGRVEAWLDVPERFAQSLAVDSLQVEAPGIDEPLTSLSLKQVRDVHERTRTFPLVLTLDDRGGRLAPGMSVQAWLPVGELEPRLTVPKDAVIRNGRSAYVYKAVAQGEQTIAVQTPVEVSLTAGDDVALASDRLAEGDRVIVEGNERILSGSVIAVVGSARPQGDAALVAGE